MTEAVRYRVSMPRPHSHLFEVEARFPAGGRRLDRGAPGLDAGQLPGARVLAPRAGLHRRRRAAASRSPSSASTSAASRWTAAGNGRCVFRYRVYANELTVRTSHLDGTHGYFNGATLFFYSRGAAPARAPGRDRRPAGLADLLRARARRRRTSWRRTTTSWSTARSRWARTRRCSFTAAGVPHEVVVWGEPQLDENKLLRDLQKICETEAQLFGGLPMKRYLFLIYLHRQGPRRPRAQGLHRAALPAQRVHQQQGLGGLPHPRLRTSTSTSGT